MKRNPQDTDRTSRRGGAALIVVLSLLGALAFLGFLFYGFAAQERASAENFAEASTPRLELPPDMYWDWALEQLILGPTDSLENSALYGGKWSILPNMIGSLNPADQTARDVNPFDGTGIGIMRDTNSDGIPDARPIPLRDPMFPGIPAFNFDVNADGLADTTDTNFVFNFSAAANGGTPRALPIFEPDAGYTYPDANSMFLAFDGVVRDPTTGQDFRVIMPSFLRPQYFPPYRDPSATATFFETLYTDANTVNQVFRPHRDHVNAVDMSPRYLTGPTNAQSGDRRREINPFPFTNNQNGDAFANVFGVWRARVAGEMLSNGNQGPQFAYEYDVDADEDGIPDAIWMDLDFPIVDLPDGRQFVPLFGFKVIDADALLNLNAHGNINNFITRLADGSITDFNGTAAARLANISINASNQGLSPSEVNLSLAFSSNPSLDRNMDNVVDGYDASVMPPEVGHIDQGLQGSPVVPVEALDVEDSLLQYGRNFLADFLPAFANMNTADPANLPSQQLMANLELLFLLTGHQLYEKLPPAGSGNARLTRSLPEGRWGDTNMIARFMEFVSTTIDSGSGNWRGAPAPGGLGVDDDGDSNRIGLSDAFGGNGDDDINAPIGQTGGGFPYLDGALDSSGNIPIPPFVHPLDFSGTGISVIGGGVGMPYTRRLAQPTILSTTSNPSQWVQYYDPGMPFQWGLWQYQWGNLGARHPWLPPGSFQDVPVGGVLPWTMAGANGELQNPNTFGDFLLDEGDEVILDLDFRNTDYDSVFAPSAMEGLHLSRGQFNEIGGDGRLKKTLPFNLDKSRISSKVANRLTTSSWDRLDFAQARTVNPGTEDSRAWEYNNWTGTGPFFNSNPTAPASGNLRTFPPQFGNVNAGSAQDPFRREVRVLLKSDFEYRQHLDSTPLTRFPRHRLNLNRIIADDPGGPAAFEPAPSFDPQFRNLVPHPDFTDTVWPAGMYTIPAMIHDHNAALPTTPSMDMTDLSGPASINKGQAQEWWARYDRQRLARDIYMLLWTLGGVEEYANPATDAVKYIQATGTYPIGTPPYTPAQIEEMAQFAVNYVDAMDRDSVITRFEYDDEPRDGWNSSPSEVVYGVEAQSLTFSEALWIQTEELPSDNADTLWDDMEARGHQYLHFELRNASPFDVTMTNDSWRIIRVADGTNPWHPMSNPALASFEFNQHPENVVRAGRTFLIACQDNQGANMGRSADFYVNFAGGNEMEAIVPYRVNDASTTLLPPAIARPDPLSDLDLNFDSYTGPTRFALTMPRGPGATLVDNMLDEAETQMTLVLQRRPNHLGNGNLNYGANDWVDVDRMIIDKQMFNPESMVMPPPPPPAVPPPDMAVRLAELVSTERLEPLDDEQQDGNAADLTSMPPNPRNHTLGDPRFETYLTDRLNTASFDTDDRNQPNSRSPDPFTLWQPHFDRDFSSVMELLSVPVFGPHELTERLSTGGTNPRLSGFDSAGMPSAAAGRFLNTDLLGDTNYQAPSGLADDNRWYRLLELVGVPNRAEQSIRNRVDRITRTPGKINLNTVRHETVLAALIDDPHIQRFPFDDDHPTLTSRTFPTTDTIEAARNWYVQFLGTRDGLDDSTTTGLLLPGLPNSRPVRSLSHVDPAQVIASGGAGDLTADRTEDTILRNHNPTTPLANLGIFEARPITDVGTDAVDYHTRNRLLAKIANNTTNRSNVFVVWLAVEYFEAHELPSGAVQIGGRLDGSPSHRGFFIIDRTELEKAYDPTDNTFDWRSFVIHRRTIR